MTGFAINRSLSRDDFPFTIWALRDDTNDWAWGVTLHRPPPGDALVPLHVPPLASYEGVPVYVVTIDANGRAVRTGPYGPEVES